mmetsp:Transcript_117671/g.333492  ORF Transcript_117671/g.333492 Transcript_117671/m.333492 type:complete len:226 (+) Transcript_117671:219-896(+)
MPRAAAAPESDVPSAPLWCCAVPAASWCCGDLPPAPPWPWAGDSCRRFKLFGDSNLPGDFTGSTGPPQIAATAVTVTRRLEGSADFFVGVTRTGAIDSSSFRVRGGGVCLTGVAGCASSAIFSTASCCHRPLSGYLALMPSSSSSASTISELAQLRRKNVPLCLSTFVCWTWMTNSVQAASVLERLDTAQTSGLCPATERKRPLRVRTRTTSPLRISRRPLREAA